MSISELVYGRAVLVLIASLIGATWVGGTIAGHIFSVIAVVAFATTFISSRVCKRLLQPSTPHRLIKHKPFKGRPKAPKAKPWARPLDYNGHRKERINKLGFAWEELTHDMDQTGTIVYRFNSFGFRGPDYNPDALYVVHIFGESDAFGLGVDFEDIWAVKVAREKAAEAGFSPKEVCIMNFAESGASCGYIARMLVAQCNAIQPDLVLIQLPFDRRVEIVDGLSSYFAGAWLEEPESVRQLERSIAESSTDQDHLKEVLERSKHFISYCTEQQGRHQSIQSLLMMQQYVQLHEIPMFVTGTHISRFTPPALREDTRVESIAALLSEEIFRDLSIHKILAEHPSFDDVHMGKAAHEVVAKLVLEVL